MIGSSMLGLEDSEMAAVRCQEDSGEPESVWFLQRMEPGDEERLLLSPREEVTLGRGLNVTYRLFAKTCPLMISRNHCTLRLASDGQWTVTDNKSLNGVRINGALVEPLVPRVVKEGDRLQLGVPLEGREQAEYEFQLIQEKQGLPESEGPNCNSGYSSRSKRKYGREEVPHPKWKVPRVSCEEDWRSSEARYEGRSGGSSSRCKETTSCSTDSRCEKWSQSSETRYDLTQPMAAGEVPGTSSVEVALPPAHRRGSAQDGMTTKPGGQYYREHKMERRQQEGGRPSAEQQEVERTSMEQRERERPSMEQRERERPSMEQRERERPSMEQRERARPRMELQERARPRMEQRERARPRMEQRERPSMEQRERERPSMELRERQRPSMVLREGERPRMEQRERPRMEQRERPSVEQRERERPSMELRERERPSMEQRERERPSVEQRERERPSVEQRERERPSVELRERERPSVEQRERVEQQERERPSLDQRERERPSVEQQERERPSLDQRERPVTEKRELEHRELEAALQQQRRELEEIIKAKDRELEERKSEKEQAQRREAIAEITDVLENELQCIICSEHFIQAVTLNCSHSFCSHCIGEWRKRKQECPMCRQPIHSQTRSVVLDSCIDRMLETLSEEVRVRRVALIKQRRALQVLDVEGASDSNSSSFGNLSSIGSSDQEVSEPSD